MTPQQIDAMKLALEALEKADRHCPVNTEAEVFVRLSITALREALAEHAMQEVQRLGQEIEQEPEEHRLLRRKWFGHRDTGHLSFTEAVDVTMEKIYSQPKQEPVAWMDVDGNVSDNNDHKCFPIPLYTQPPQRTEQEPVAIKRMKEWIEYLKRKSDFGQHMKIPSEMSAGTCWELALELEQFINTSPPQHKPLTEEQIFACENSVPDEVVSDRDWCIHFARAIEAKLKENA